MQHSGKPAFIFQDNIPFDDAEQSIPLLSDDEERRIDASNIPDALPILPLKNTVLYPGVVIPITVGRDRSLELVRSAYANDKTIGVVAQKDNSEENPTSDGLHRVGTVAQILKLIKMPDGTKSIVIQGKNVFETISMVQEEPYFMAQVQKVVNKLDLEGVEMDAAIRSLKETATQIVNLSPNIPSEAAVAIQNINSPAFLLNFIASNLNISVDDKQRILATPEFSGRLALVMEHLKKELQVLNLSEEIRSKVKTDIDQQQRDFYLRQQMKAIQEALGDNTDQSVIEGLKERAAQKMMPEHAKAALDKELERLERTPSGSPNYGMQFNYVEWLLDLPWEHYTTDKLDLNIASDVLDEDHYGLEKVKKRIIEYLAVLKLKKDMKAPILCFYGPPGTGKTSLGKSIARALNREFVRFSLGGLQDEAEIRGHRRTYIGALPGRILQSLKKAGTSNPVLMLDEIDKVGMSYRGDPTSALLEVLDPEQNNAFNDNYLELDYDLSKVLFIATANSLDTIPGPLRDRMEIITISGYTLEEKTQIARKYLVPDQIRENGLSEDQFSITDAAISAIIDGYTRESGVRNLNREIGSVVRGVASKIARDLISSENVDRTDVETYLGKQKFFSDVAERTQVPGVATGLAWTPFGGDILFIEASVSPGNGKLTITGQLGDVMKESAVLALSYLKANSETLGIPATAFTEWDLHLHVPAGAVPKDGPSAGVSIMSAIASIFTQRRVKNCVALTGEITLRGMVLPVGGIKEKVLAAKRAGIRQVLIPRKNEKDFLEIEQETIADLEVSYLERMEQVLELALEKDAVEDPALKYASRKTETHKNDADAAK